jgi:hypothetical protein
LSTTTTTCAAKASAAASGTHNQVIHIATTCGDHEITRTGKCVNSVSFATRSISGHSAASGIYNIVYCDSTAYGDAAAYLYHE